MSPVLVPSVAMPQHDLEAEAPVVPAGALTGGNSPAHQPAEPYINREKRDGWGGRNSSLDDPLLRLTLSESQTGAFLGAFLGLGALT